FFILPPQRGQFGVLMTPWNRHSQTRVKPYGSKEEEGVSDTHSGRPQEYRQALLNTSEPNQGNA
ncbi:hypothetical protein, partial [Bifidobacterium pseudolongum]|uniref:hypothetical protein n=2 Tax=Bifidobacterium TaxID=1678 RepID=UPI001A9392F4